jgi:hypothetical protein
MPPAHGQASTALAFRRHAARPILGKCTQLGDSTGYIESSDSGSSAIRSNMEKFCCWRKGGNPAVLFAKPLCSYLMDKWPTPALHRIMVS